MKSRIFAAVLFGSDDRGVKYRMKLVDWHHSVRLAIHTMRTVGRGEPIWTRAAHFLPSQLTARRADDTLPQPRRHDVPMDYPIYKNIVICSDGTGNTTIKGRGTNVFKLFEAVDVNGHRTNPALRRQLVRDGAGERHAAHDRGGPRDAPPPRSAPCG